MGSKEPKLRAEDLCVQYGTQVKGVAAGHGVDARVVPLHLQFPQEIHDIKQIYLKMESTQKSVKHVIYVLGTTGVGKSKLAIQLA